MFPLTPDGIRKRFKAAGMRAVPDDRECALLLEATRIQSEKAGRPVDVIGATMRQMKKQVGLMKMAQQKASKKQEAEIETRRKKKRKRRRTKRGKRRPPAKA